MCTGSGQEELSILFMGDEIPENRENVMKIMNRLQFPIDIPGFEVKIVADIKLLVILLGLNTCGGVHNCVFCEVNINL